MRMPHNIYVRIFGLAAAAVTIVTGLIFGGVYVASSAKLRVATVDPIDFTVDVASDPEVIEHGRHIARTRGCFGCHGQQLEGKDFDTQWDWPKRAVAPNLAQYARDHDATVLEAAIRQGIGANGRALTSMPSYNFTRLNDADLSALIAFLRAAPVVEIALPKPALGWSARWDIAFGGERTMAAWADLVPPLTHDPVAAPQLARGEYLAMTMCNECHGLDVRGQTFYPPFTPDLAMVAAIDRAEFERIITTGIGMGERPLGLMQLVAPDRFPDLHDEEIDALYAYLTSLAEEPVAENVVWRPER